MTSRVRVFSPATLSNLGPGFDVVGLALNEPGDSVEVELSDAAGVEIAEISGEGGALSHDVHENVAGVAAAHLLERARRERRTPVAASGLRLRLHKGIPIASGLGGSAASSVAAAFAVNDVLGRPFSKGEIVESALAGERVAAVTPHADNIAPCLFGGLVLVRSLAPLDIVALPVPDALHLAVVHPHCCISTAKARALLKDRRYPLDDIVANVANFGAFVAALHRGDLALLGRTISDRLVEPVRAPLVPGFTRVKDAALANGALACSISGSGPTLFAMAESRENAQRVAAAMQAAFAEAAGLESDAFVGQVNARGTMRT